MGEGPKKRKQPPTHRDLQGTPLGQSVKNLIRVEKEGNGGSSVVPELKYCVKLGRQNGIHVTPTCLWNGLVEGYNIARAGGDGLKGCYETASKAGKEQRCTIAVTPPASR